MTAPGERSRLASQPRSARRPPASARLLLCPRFHPDASLPVGLQLTASGPLTLLQRAPSERPTADLTGSRPSSAAFNPVRLKLSEPSLDGLPDKGPVL